MFSEIFHTEKSIHAVQFHLLKSLRNADYIDKRRVLLGDGKDWQRGMEESYYMKTLEVICSVS